MDNNEALNIFINTLTDTLKKHYQRKTRSRLTHPQRSEEDYVTIGLQEIAVKLPEIVDNYNPNNDVD